MVAMSGGVDSSLSAVLLRKADTPIAGMFMKNWEEDDAGGQCTAERDAADARRVAEQLGIRFHARNFAAEYWDSVFARFLAEYRAGRTPNPDVLCNSEIKFKVFLEHAEDLGAERIATGHYARSRRDDEGCVRLLRGADPGKDQSYFLYGLNQAQLARALFPVGELHKSEVRRQARSAGLPVHAKKDSTGICFVGERRFREFLQTWVPPATGEIRTPQGAVIGTHPGVHFFTLGQRKGLGIGGVRGAADAPWYVIAKDHEQRLLWVSQRRAHPCLMSDRLHAAQCNWIASRPQPGRRLTAKTRYRQPDQPCRVLSTEADRMKLVFDAPQWAVTPGQSVVLYDGEQCLGGGVIEWTNATEI